MDFELSEEQRMLKASVGKLLGDRYALDQRRRHMAEDVGFSADMWRRFADLGLLALPLPAEHGGLGGGAVEMMIVMEAFGRSLVIEPYFATVILGAGVLRHGASDAQKAALFPQIAEGALKLAFAYAEPQSDSDLFDVATRAVPCGEGWVLDGAKTVVLHGAAADKLLVTARTQGARLEPYGIGLFMVDRQAAGLGLADYSTQDGLRAADIVLDGVRVAADDVIGSPAGGAPIVARAADDARAALCAEMVGCFDAMLAITAAFLKQREQFGVPIASFQALQHKLADMFIELEQSRSISFHALASLDDDPAERERAVSAAKAHVGRSAQAIGRQAVQLHGGIGMTDEYGLSHYFKRVTLLDKQLGDVGHHLGRLEALGGLFAATTSRFDTESGD